MREQIQLEAAFLRAMVIKEYELRTYTVMRLLARARRSGPLAPNELFPAWFPRFVYICVPEELSFTGHGQSVGHAGGSRVRIRVTYQLRIAPAVLLTVPQVARACSVGRWRKQVC